MDFIKHTFNEDIWVIYLIDDDDEVLSDTDTDAEVEFDKKEIYFKRDKITLNIVLHELFHVYVGYCYLDDADLNMLQTEEVLCSLFADKGEAIVNKAKDIYNKLKDLRDGGIG